MIKRNKRTGQVTSAGMKAVAREGEVIQEGTRRLLRTNAAARYLGVTRKTIQNWTTEGCPYLENNICLVPEKREWCGQPAGYYDQADLDKIIKARATHPKDLTADDCYSVERVSELTGLSTRSIRATKFLKRHGLEKVYYRVKAIRESPRHRRHQVLLRAQLGLRKTDIENFIARYKVPPGKITMADFAAKLRIHPTTIQVWAHNCPLLGRGLVKEIREFFTPAGIRSGYLLTVDDLNLLRNALAGVKRGKDKRPISTHYPKPKAESPAVSEKTLPESSQKIPVAAKPEKKRKGRPVDEDLAKRMADMLDAVRRQELGDVRERGKVTEYADAHGIRRQAASEAINRMLRDEVSEKYRP